MAIPRNTYLLPEKKDYKKSIPALAGSEKKVNKQLKNLDSMYNKHLERDTDDVRSKFDSIIDQLIDEIEDKEKEIIDLKDEVTGLKGQIEILETLVDELQQER